MLKNIIGLAFLIVLISCNSKERPLSEAEKETLLLKGDSIASQAQKTLLQNVSQAIQTKGVAGAVDFCNEHAVLLTDSMAKLNTVHIQRLSDKNRNPKNDLTNELDKKIWSEMQELMQDSTVRNKHIIAKEGNAIYYYKAIPIGMPTCLSCHGSKDKDIAPETLQIINIKYPSDKATDYQMGQLRGIWKINLNL